MSLNVIGRGGELRHGRRVVARLASFWKQDKKVTFTCDYVNAFAAGLGPPTAIALQVSPKARLVYPVTGGSVEAGAVSVDPMQMRAETL